MRRGVQALLALAAVAALVAGAWPALAEEGQAPASLQQQKQQQQNDQLIQQIQRDNEAVLSGRQFTYDPAGRRDPFEPLIKAEAGKPDGKRPKGVSGMMIAEIDLRGVATDVNGQPVALFRGSDNRPYSLRAGDIVYDGRVLSIDARRGEVVFRQQVDDPRRIKPYRDVIKRLQVTGGEEEESSAAEEEGA